MEFSATPAYPVPGFTTPLLQPTDAPQEVNETAAAPDVAANAPAHVPHAADGAGDIGPADEPAPKKASPGLYAVPVRDRPRATGGLLIANAAAIVIPFLAVLGAVYLMWGWGFSWLDLSLMVGMYIFTGFGITVGFHRYFTHKSFETSPTIQFILAVMGSMTIEGTVYKWSCMHRRHHHHSDEEEDPHSPHLHGHGWKGFLQGLWHSHVGWILNSDPGDLYRYAPDLEKSRVVQFVSKTFGYWALLGLIIPAVIGGLVTMSWWGAFLGFVWGGAVRVFLLHHVTWSINSACHLWGKQDYRSHDESRNNPVFGILALGEGWHNNHHAFPTSAKHGLKWWQFDLSWCLIKFMKLTGLAWNVRVPDKQTMEAKRIDKDSAPVEARA